MKWIKEQKQIETYYRQFPLDDYFSFDIRFYTKIVRFEPDELILREGDEPEYLYYLIEGRAKAFLTQENGRVSIANFLTAPAFIGELELLDAQQFASGVRALTVCTCFAIQKQLCREQMLQDTRFLRKIAVYLGKKTSQNTDNYMNNLSYSLDVRLANFILQTASGGYYRERHTEAAEYLGVTYRHLLYVLADFVKKGIVKKTPRGYQIADIQRLMQIAGKMIDTELK